MCHHTTCISPTVESEAQLQYYTVKQGRVGLQVTEGQVFHHTTCISPTVESEVQLQYYTVKQGRVGMHGAKCLNFKTIQVIFCSFFNSHLSPIKSASQN